MRLVVRGWLRRLVLASLVVAAMAWVESTLVMATAMVLMAWVMATVMVLMAWVVAAVMASVVAVMAWVVVVVVITVVFGDGCVRIAIALVRHRAIVAINAFIARMRMVLLSTIEILVERCSGGADKQSQGELHHLSILFCYYKV